MHRIALAVGLLASTAAADGARVEVEVGKTVERDVAIATGWFCDDPSILNATIVTRKDRNFWIVQGAKLGATVCRVGTDPSRPSFVFEVHVVPPTKRR